MFESFVIEYMDSIEIAGVLNIIMSANIIYAVKIFDMVYKSWMLLMFPENECVYVKFALTKYEYCRGCVFRCIEIMNTKKVCAFKKCFLKRRRLFQQMVFEMCYFWHYQHNNEHVKLFSSMLQWKFMTRCTVHTHNTHFQTKVMFPKLEL